MWNSFDSFGYGMHTPGWFVFAPLLGVWALVVIALKGYTLWHAAKRNELWWFVFLLVINTLGILELIYIIFVLKKLNSPMGMEGPHHHDHPHHHHHDHTEHDHSEPKN